MPRGVELTRITIVEDHELFAEALDLAITLQGHAVGRVSTRARDLSVAGLLKAILKQRPQIVLLDLDLGPTVDGRELVRPLTQSGAGVIVLSATEDRARLGECVRLGARSVVSKAAPLNVIIGRIRCVATGLPALEPEVREQLLASHEHEQEQLVGARAALSSLSRREGEVLGELMAGTTVTDIARSSYVSEATVRTQVKSIRAKLGVCSQLAAVGIATRARWQPPHPRVE